MRFWWVNQNQTFEQEFRGGYIWSPQRKANGVRNPFYEFMRAVAPGDAVFSFARAKVPAVGIAKSYAYQCPKPPEFGSAGPNWSEVGWMVDVDFVRLSEPIRPADHMSLLAPLLPTKYAPLQADGRGLQGVYLTMLSDEFARLLVSLIGAEASQIVSSSAMGDFDRGSAGATGVGQEEWEEHIADQIRGSQLEETEKRALILARRGQGLFKKRVHRVERACRVTGVDRIDHLRASHCKPWRDSDDEERLDGENGLLLTPSIDHLFDRGFISFEGSGRLLVSSRAHRSSLERMGVPTKGSFNAGGFTEGQRRYLEYHRERVFLEADVR